VRFVAFMTLVALPALAAQDNARFFDVRVAPIIEHRCLGCHNEELKNGNISFLDRESLLRGGPHGPAVIPGKPAQSMLMLALRHEGELQMPPGPKLPSKEISVLRQWIQRGAPWGRSKLRR